MKAETYLIAAFIWKYKDTLESSAELSVDESIYIANDLVKDYLASDDYDSQNPTELDSFFGYVEQNMTDYLG